jgi:methylmalonyl-CoA mutase
VADVDAPMALAGDFPDASLDDWLALAGDVERLRSTTYDGISVDPLYTAADATADVGLPGFAPFVRGRTSAGTRRGWDVRQAVDASQGRGAAVAELERGATSVWLRVGGRGDPDEATLGGLLDGVLLDAAPVVLDAGTRWLAAATALTRVWAARGADPERVGGSFGADPFGGWLADRDGERLDTDLQALASEALLLTAEHPNVRVATVDGTRFHDRGASDAQELGYTIAAAVATLRALADGALDIEAAFAQVELRLAATVDQFATIAKLRAARRLLARLAEVAGAPNAAGRVPLHAVTSRAMATRYDAAVNVVRATVACFAAAVGGADAITVLPHDALRGGGASELGRRLARNTQSVLALETHASTVIDAAGGSWYVERFTEQLAERAWDTLQHIEAAGGFGTAAAADIVEAGLAASRAARGIDVDHRRAKIVGVSAFPSVGDVAEPADAPEYRWAAQFEVLRVRVDASAAGGRRPAVLLAIPGNPARATAMTTAAANYFRIAGFETPRQPVGGDAAGLAETLAKLGTSVACVCAGTDVEAAVGERLAAALATAGATRVYSAAALPSDARAALADLLDHLGIP